MPSPSQADIVNELYSRRDTLPPDHRAAVEELYGRLNTKGIGIRPQTGWEEFQSKVHQFRQDPIGFLNQKHEGVEDMDETVPYGLLAGVVPAEGVAAGTLSNLAKAPKSSGLAKVAGFPGRVMDAYAAAKKSSQAAEAARLAQTSIAQAGGRVPAARIDLSPKAPLDITPIPPPTGKLPSGRVPGGIQTQTMSPAQTVQRPIPAWKSIQGSAPATSEVAPISPPEGALPSGRKPGGLSNQTPYNPSAPPASVGQPPPGIDPRVWGDLSTQQQEGIWAARNAHNLRQASVKPPMTSAPPAGTPPPLAGSVPIPAPRMGKPNVDPVGADLTPVPAPTGPMAPSPGGVKGTEDMPLVTEVAQPGTEAPHPMLAGATRANAAGGQDTLMDVPLEKIQPASPTPYRPQGNTIYPDKVKEYQNTAVSAPPELRSGENGNYETFDGHHRIEAAKANGKKSILSWVPKTGEAAPVVPPPPKGPPSLFATASDISPTATAIEDRARTRDVGRLADTLHGEIPAKNAVDMKKEDWQRLSKGMGIKEPDSRTISDTLEELRKREAQSATELKPKKAPAKRKKK